MFQCAPHHYYVLLTGLLVTLDVVLHYCDIFKLNMHAMLPMQIVCTFSITITCFWVFVCNAVQYRGEWAVEGKIPSGYWAFVQGHQQHDEDSLSGLERDDTKLWTI